MCRSCNAANEKYSSVQAFHTLSITEARSPGFRSTSFTSSKLETTSPLILLPPPFTVVELCMRGTNTLLARGGADVGAVPLETSETITLLARTGVVELRMRGTTTLLARGGADVGAVPLETSETSTSAPVTSLLSSVTVLLSTIIGTVALLSSGRILADVVALILGTRTLAGELVSGVGGCVDES